MKLVDTIVLDKREIVEICENYLRKYHGIIFKYNTKLNILKDINSEYKFEFIINEKDTDIYEEDFNDVACDIPRGM
jgi:hypothetical protein